MRTKYNSRKTIVYGIAFDSRKEANRYLVLRDLERQGKITDLKMQVPFLLIPAQRAPETVGPKGGTKMGKLLERSCEYYADFVYNRNGETVVEDAKGVRTDDYIIKRKLMLYTHGIRVREV